MKDMNPEIVRKGLIDVFDFILELDRKPETLEKLPKKGLMIKEGNKRLIVSTKKEPKIVLL